MLKEIKTVNFSSLNLKAKEEVKTIKIGETDIEVKQYLPADEKDTLLNSVIQEADRGTVINTFGIDVFFHLFIVMYYTNLVFEEDIAEDRLALFDILETNDVINQVISAIPEAEYVELKTNLELMLDEYAVYRNSARGLIDELGMLAPVQAEGISEIVQNMDIDKVENVLNLAKATGLNNK